MATLLGCIPEAAGHDLLGGPLACQSGTVSANAADSISLTDSALIDGTVAGVRTFVGWWLYIVADAAGQTTLLAGTTRQVTDNDLSTGKLLISSNAPWARSLVSGDQYWLLRQFSRAKWKDFANQALRQMKRRTLVTQQGGGLTSTRYAVPAAIVRPEDVIDIGTRSFPEASTDGAVSPVRWFGWESNDGVLTAIVGDPVPTTQELVYEVIQPYATAGQNLLSADSDVTTAPQDWLVAEMVARSLVAAWSQAPAGDARTALGQQLGEAGRLVQGFRAHYTPGSQRRALPLDPRF